MGYYGDLMWFYGDLMGFYGDFMGFYGDFMGIWWDSMGIKLGLHGDIARVYYYYSIHGFLNTTGGLTIIQGNLVLRCVKRVFPSHVSINIGDLVEFTWIYTLVVHFVFERLWVCQRLWNPLLWTCIGLDSTSMLGVIINSFFSGPVSTIMFWCHVSVEVLPLDSKSPFLNSMWFLNHQFCWCFSCVCWINLVFFDLNQHVKSPILLISPLCSAQILPKISFSDVP